ncbi:hypothetical protein K440DRAFT_656619 [Wilcoxina mikolae CBS 423.85]|nr:hypothetical protein K440DRAFT_656619 [Wilcoxina mikolae CBS 423.85]
MSSSTTPSDPPWVLSISCYGRGDPALNDAPGHRGLALHHNASDVCRMHHIRCPDDESFIYDPRSQPLEEASLWGRVEIAVLSEEMKYIAEASLTEFGNDRGNIPDMALEGAGVVRKEDGEAGFWREMRNCGHEEVAEKVKARGGRWIPRPERLITRNLWMRREMGNVKSLLEAKMGGRGLVISSPFFSMSRPVAKGE